MAAIREFVRAIHMYMNHIEMTQEDRSVLMALQDRMCETDELRSLFVLLLRHYNPKHQTKQYLQVVILIVFFIFSTGLTMPLDIP